jgi:hypothetical protein
MAGLLNQKAYYCFGRGPASLRSLLVTPARKLVPGYLLRITKIFFFEKSSAGHEFITLVIHDRTVTSCMPDVGSRQIFII